MIIRKWGDARFGKISPQSWASFASSQHAAACLDSVWINPADGAGNKAKDVPRIHKCFGNQRSCREAASWRSGKGAETVTKGGQEYDPSRGRVNGAAARTAEETQSSGNIESEQLSVYLSKVVISDYAVLRYAGTLLWCADRRY